MSTWVISLLGIVVITLICDVILPQGQTTKYVKTVISIIIVCAIVFPLVQVVKDIDLSLVSSDDQFGYQQHYLDYVKNQKEVVLESDCVGKLAENGFKNCVVDVNLDENLIATSVVVSVDEQYLTQDFTQSISKVITSVVNVKQSEVKCIGKD